MDNSKVSPVVALRLRRLDSWVRSTICRHGFSILQTNDSSMYSIATSVGLLKVYPIKHIINEYNSGYMIPLYFCDIEQASNSFPITADGSWGCLSRSIAGVKQQFIEKLLLLYYEAQP